MSEAYCEILLNQDITEELHLVYQPIVNLITGEITSLEALVRWTSPIYGSISPDIFIPLAEKLDIVPRISKWVINSVLDQIFLWRQYNVNIAINISPKELESLSFLQHIISGLSKHRLSKNSISLEITERNLYNNFDIYIGNLNILNRLDIRVKLDDFGVGHSGLLRLLEFPFKELKIDMALTPQTRCDQRKIAVCRAITQLSDSLGFTVIVEGVESEIQRDILIGLGIQFGQGYYFAQPMLPEAAGVLLSSSSARLPIKNPL
jgi:EAL domain-containing protein (putative c-di-GMP-specific phosphodiesterase class I)